VNYVVALYDFSAQADGDLDFKVGDRIEVVERTDSSEDWWTGRLDGRTGVFPGGCQLFLSVCRPARLCLITTPRFHR
jgi:hypothetical protein